MEIPAAEEMRPPRVAGLFYSDNAEELKSQIEQFYRGSEIDPHIGKIYGIVAPHAGYAYSGSTAAWAYRQLKERTFDTVVIIAPSHREYFPGASIFPGKGYATPLGDVEIDRDAVDFLIRTSPLIRTSAEGHGEEHALEVQIPFLQTVLRGFRIVPIVMGEQGVNTIENVARAIAGLKNIAEVLFVASSDLSHFYRREQAERLDRRVLECIEKFDEGSLQSEISGRKCEACGAGPVIAVMKASRLAGASRGKVLKYSTSGDVTGDNNRVVGYMSAAFYSPTELQ